MRDLDSRAQTKMKNIDLLADNYLRNQKSLSSEERKEKLNEIQGLFNIAKVGSLNSVSRLYCLTI